MKRFINKFIDWFEDKFNFIIDALALLGGAFCIFLAIFVLVNLIVSDGAWLEGIDVVFIPGLIGFFGIIILFALRITRNLTKK
jgi:ABC-type cobalamin transport system permease subunit